MRPRNFFRHLINVPVEAIVWIAGLSFLAFSYPDSQDHLTVCPLALAGLDWCPGCGLGRSVSYLFHGELAHSIKTHPLAIPAVIILTFRIFQLLKKHINSYGANH